MLSIIMSALLSIGVSFSSDAKLDEATQKLHDNNGKIIVDSDGRYDIGWEESGMD